MSCQCSYEFACVQFACVQLKKEKEWVSDIWCISDVYRSKCVSFKLGHCKTFMKLFWILSKFVNESRVGFHLSCCCYSCVAAKHLKKLARGFLVFVRWKIMETLHAEPQLRNALKYPFFSQSWHFLPCLFMVRGFRDFELKYQAFCDWYLILSVSFLDLLLVCQ